LKSGFITERDLKVTKSALLLRDATCADLPEEMSDEDKDAMYNYLQRSSDPNVFQEALSKPVGEGELLSAKLEEAVRARGLVYTSLRKGKGVLGSTFVMAFFLIFFWQATPCLYNWCTRKTRVTKPRTCGKVSKSFLLILCGGTIISVAVVGYVGNQHANLLDVGVKRMTCTAAGFTAMFLYGGSNDASLGDSSFLGMLPFLESLEKLVSSFEEPKVDKFGYVKNPTHFVPRARAILDETSDLDKASVGLRALFDIVELTRENVYPYLATGESSQHQNDYVFRMIYAAERVRSNTTDAMFASVLDKARVEMLLFFHEQSLEAQRTLLRSGAVRLLRAMLTNLLGFAFEPFVLGDPNGVGIRQRVQTAADSFTIFYQATIALVLVFCIYVIYVVALLLFHDVVPKEPTKNPYPRMNSRSAACGWFFGCFVAGSLLFFGGILQVATWPTGMGCTILLDMDGAALQSYQFLNISCAGLGVRNHGNFRGRCL
jgi:hypothetical protein